MDITEFTYEELEATFRRKRRKAMPKLWSYVKKIQDPYRPKYYTRIELFVPQPNFLSPFPCILISIRNSKFKAFFRVLDLAAVDEVFIVPVDQREMASQALSEAKRQADDIEETLRHLISQKRLPGAVRAILKVDSETGEVLAKKD
jgi:hypothetical protein